MNTNIGQKNHISNKKPHSFGMGLFYVGFLII